MINEGTNLLCDTIDFRSDKQTEILSSLIRDTATQTPTTSSISENLLITSDIQSVTTSAAVSAAEHFSVICDTAFLGCS